MRHIRRVVKQYAIGMLSGRVPTADNVRMPPLLAGYGVGEDFATTTPSGLSWAGSPFSTPPTLSTMNGTWLRVTGFSANERAFLYKSATHTTLIGHIAIDTNYDGMYTGLRMDDGTDNNYVEFVLWWATSGTYRIRFYIRRSAGGTVSETEFTHLAMPILPQNIFMLLRRNASDWSSWPAEAILYGAMSVRGGSSLANTWTPTRVGWVTKFGTGSWQSSYIDILSTAG